MSEFPKMVYHDDGRHAIVASHDEHKGLGTGWDATPNDKHHTAIRKAAGAVAETVVPVNATRMETI